ncbi:hypothetical protein FACS1894187_07030 [Synergistales bacterium]|nr:hypothetical protein FACS1894187_07030 [Synergistales bacterium]
MKGLLPELGAYDMVCKFCQFRTTDESTEFHLEQGDAYRGQFCSSFRNNLKPQTVMEGEKCSRFKLDEEAELKYPLWEQRSFVCILIGEERWDILENGANAELERLWQAWEKKFGWRWNYLGYGEAGTDEEATYEELKEQAEHAEQEDDDS